MSPFQLLQLLKYEITDCKFADNTGKCKSALGALELIEMFKKQIQDETIEEFITVYKTMVPDQQARTIAANKIKERISGDTGRNVNPENSLVECR